ncbi:hypothetical protein DOTSEDRAFT_112459, partial [Dothistroma septosporum NZE10]
AILRVSSYHRRDYDLAVICLAERDHAVITTISSLQRNCSSSLGVLDQLPVELIDIVCLELDLASLFALRHVSLRGRQIVSALPEFKLITKYAVSCLHAMLRTGTASGICLCTLWHLFCTSVCSTCQKNFGNTLHLLTWKRYCTTCLRGRVHKSAVMTVAHARKQLRLRAPTLRRLPTLKTIPGIYTMEETLHKSSVHLIAEYHAFSSYRDEHGGAEPAIVRREQQSRNVFMSCCAFPSYDTLTRDVERGISCSGCQLISENQDGLREDLVFLRDKVYSKASFLKHYEECEGAQRLWNSSDDGKVQPAELPAWCKIGGYFSSR